MDTRSRQLSASTAVLTHAAMNSLAIVSDAATVLESNWERLPAAARSHLIATIADQARVGLDQLTEVMQLALGREPDELDR